MRRWVVARMGRGTLGGAPASAQRFCGAFWRVVVRSRRLLEVPMARLSARFRDSKPQRFSIILEMQAKPLDIVPRTVDIANKGLVGLRRLLLKQKDVSSLWYARSARRRHAGGVRCARDVRAGTPSLGMWCELWRACYRSRWRPLLH